MPADVDPPDRVKLSDDWLDWLAEYRRDWEERLAHAEAEHLDLEQTFLHIVALAETMEHAPIGHRRAMITAIRKEARDAGIWPPAQHGRHR